MGKIKLEDSRYCYGCQTEVRPGIICRTAGSFFAACMNWSRLVKKAKAVRYKCIDKENDKRITMLAMAIVNHTNELAGASVETRQAINDRCFDFAVEKIKEAIVLCQK